MNSHPVYNMFTSVISVIFIVNFGGGYEHAFLDIICLILSYSDIVSRSFVAGIRNLSI